MTDGLHHLREIAETISQAEIARRTEVSQQTVSCYLRRVARPDEIVRERMEHEFGIPRTSWRTPEEERHASGRAA